MTPLTKLALTLGLAWIGVGFSAQSAAAQGPKLFYCYAPNPATGVVYMSDVHPVGPVSERGSYGTDFSDYLAKWGKVPSGTQAYCVMRGSEHEIDAARANFPEQCDVCEGAKQLSRVNWMRGGGSTKLATIDMSSPAERPAPRTPQRSDAATIAPLPTGGGTRVMRFPTTPPAPVPAAPASRSTLTRMYAGLKITFTSVMTETRGVLAFVNATNTRSDDAIVFEISRDGQAILLKTVQPGETFKGPIGPGGVFDVLVQRRKREDRSPSVIDMAKAYIRAKVTTGKPAKPASSGIRG